MSLTRRGVLLLAGKTLLLLPLCVAGWYLAAGLFAWIPGKIAGVAVRAAAGAPTAVTSKQRALQFTLTLEMPYRPGSTPRIAADVGIDPGKYTYGIALFAALALAAGGWRRPGALALGIAILVVIPAFGIACEVLARLGAVAGFAPFLAWGVTTREAIALGYQVGSLLLPALAPVILWLALFPQVWRGDSLSPPGKGPG